MIFVLFIGFKIPLITCHSRSVWQYFPVRANLGAFGYHHHGAESGQPERRSPDRQQLDLVRTGPNWSSALRWWYPDAPSQFWSSAPSRWSLRRQVVLIWKAAGGASEALRVSDC